MKAGPNRNELCYSFIYETSWLCDFEAATDELCALIGDALSLLPPDMPDLAADLDRLQPLAFHANGSIRGRLAVEENDIAWLEQRLEHYHEEVRDRLTGFVLPRGDTPVPQLNQARACAKRAIRMLVRVEQEGREIPPVVPRLCNLMANFFFILTLVVNRRRGVEEVPFISKSYSFRQRRAKPGAA